MSTHKIRWHVWVRSELVAKANLKRKKNHHKWIDIINKALKMYLEDKISLE